jgi:hypothetical protein
LPDGIFSNQKSKFGCLAKEDVGIFYCHWVYFAAIWYFLAIWYRYFVVVWYFLPVLVRCT